MIFVSETKEEKAKIGSNYGMKFNIRLNIRDLILPINWLIKMNIKDSTTIMRFIVFILAVPGAIGLSIYYLTGNWLRVKYLTFDFVWFLIGFTGLVAMYALVNPAIGSNLTSSKVFITQIYKRIKWNLHLAVKDTDTGLDTVLNDGTVVFSNGDVGRVFAIDGATSATAYPKEIAIQEGKAIRFHKARTTSTTIFNITTSQRQDAQRQIKEQEHLMRANTNEAIQSLIMQEKNNMETSVDGVASTLVQHQMYRDKRERGLRDAIDHLAQMDAEGYMASVIALDKPQTEEILKDIIQLRTTAS